MNSDFENRLQDQPLREIPDGWRAKIMAAAQPAPPWWRQWLWPCPQAWSALAAVWVVILGMNLAAGKSPGQPPGATVVCSRQELQGLKEQQQRLAQLVSPGEPMAAEPPKAILAPRSERRRAIVAV
jgi:hypothetical protein